MSLPSGNDPGSSCREGSSAEGSAESGIVGRLAPSPTGLLHLGHARTFLLAWWSARSRGGRVVLRFDDLDGQRSRRDFASQAQTDLEWLGLDWDGTPTWQSAHQASFDRAIRELSEGHLCYPCVCSRRDVEEAIAAPHGTQSEPRYPGTCRDKLETSEQAQASFDKPSCLRFRVPSGEVRFSDGLFGEQSFDVQQTVGDFVIRRRDGSTAYQLAVVIDDHEQGVTEVVRGEDLLSSTARQLLLQRALHLPHPRWIHVPLVNDSSGQRLAKRSDSSSLRSLREGGMDARAIVAWAARGAGLEMPERCTVREVLTRFDWARVPHGPTNLPGNPLEELT